MSSLPDSKELKFVFLPNYNISNTFSSSTIGVFVGIYTGIIINLLVANEWRFEKYVLLGCNIIAVLLLWTANTQNNRVKELCEDLKFKDEDNKFKTTHSVLNELWGQTDVEKRYVYRKYKYRFIMSLYSSFIIVFLGVGFYAYKGSIQTSESTKPKQIKGINNTQSRMICNPSRFDTACNEL